jgi:hypothetical protein
MHRTKGISPKLAGAICPPLTAVVTAMILTGSIDRASIAALAAIAIGAALGYQAPRGETVASAPVNVATSSLFTPFMPVGPGTQVSWTTSPAPPVATTDAAPRDASDTRAIPDNPDQP